MRKSECYLYYYLFIALSCVCLDHRFAHMVDRQNAFADDDSGNDMGYLWKGGAQNPVSWLAHLSSSHGLLVCPRSVSIDNNPFYSLDLSY